MADMALFATDEFERIRLSWEKGHGVVEALEGGLTSMASSAFSALGANVGEGLSFLQQVQPKDVELASRFLEPRSPFGFQVFERPSST